MQIEIAAAPGGKSVVAAYAHVTWFPARSAAEKLNATAFLAVTITADALNPKPHRVMRTFSSAAAIRRLLGFLNSRPAGPDVAVACPAQDVSYQLRFTPRDPRGTQVLVTTQGCPGDSVSVNGRAQPYLWDLGGGLAGIAQGLLGAAVKA